MFTVTAFAGIAGVSAKVLRAYDGVGLFAPAWVDPASGYRYYTPSQLPELRRILALREVGMGLTEIAAIARGGGDLQAALTARRSALERERLDVDRRLAALEIQVALADEGADMPDVVVRRIDAEVVATLPIPAGDDVADAFYELEAYVRDRGARAHRPPGAIPGEALVFVPLRRAISPTERVLVQRLPGVRAATLLHRGDYATLPMAVERLRSWTVAAGYDEAGPLRELYLQFGAEAELRLPRGWVVERAAEFVTELQLPVAA